MWLVPPSPPSLAPTSTLSHYLGPACHCGRSRLDCSLPPLLPYLSPFPTSYIGTSRSIPSPFLPFWPGLSLWQVPPRASPFYLLSLSTLPSYLSHFSHLYIPATSSLLAWIVIVAGPANFSHFPAPSPSLSPLYHPPSDTPPFPQHSGPACHCGRSRHFLLPLYISLTSFPRPSSCRHLFTGPLYFISNLQARLAIVAGPAFPIYLSFPPSSFLPPLSTHTSSPPLSPFAPWPGLPLW